jgi:hypothetical protein
LDPLRGQAVVVGRGRMHPSGENGQEALRAS